MEIVVYADVLFALNFFMDLVMVFLVKVVTKSPASVLRLTLASAVLGIYGTLMVAPNTEIWFSFLGRVIVSFLAIRILEKKQWLKTVAVFWLISVALGGMIVAITMETSFGKTLGAVMMNGSLYLNMGVSELLIGIAGVYILIWIFCRLSVRRFSKERVLIPFSLTIDSQTIELTALLDTGCELTVPVTGDAMMLISRNNLNGVLPKETFSVSIQTASGENTILACYPKELVCLDKRYEISGIPAIGIVDTVFAEDGLYTAVLNPDMLIENGGVNDAWEMGCAYQDMATTDRLAAQAKRSILHRRKRKSSSAAQPGGGGKTAQRSGPSSKSADCPANFDREKSSAGGLYCQKV